MLTKDFMKVLDSYMSEFGVANVFVQVPFPYSPPFIPGLLCQRSPNNQFHIRGKLYSCNFASILEEDYAKY